MVNNGINGYKIQLINGPMLHIAEQYYESTTTWICIVFCYSRRLQMMINDLEITTCSMTARITILCHVSLYEGLRYNSKTSILLDQYFVCGANKKKALLYSTSDLSLCYTKKVSLLSFGINPWNILIFCVFYVK